MFYEPSTRTRTSFNTGMRELGGRYDGFSGTEGTSVMKSETVRDTVTMMCANHNDVIVMRHPLDGSLQWAADVANIPVINGGDGKNEHPTQALLDVLTIYALKEGKLDGIRVGLRRRPLPRPHGPLPEPCPFPLRQGDHPLGRGGLPGHAG